MELIEAVNAATGVKKRPALFRPLVKSVNNRNLKIEMAALCRNGDRSVLELLPPGHINN